MSSLFRRHFIGRSGVRRKAKRWTMEYRDARGRKRRLTLFPDKGASIEAARKIDALVDLARAGAPVTAVLREWLLKVPAKLRGQLALQGLVDPSLFVLSRPLAELVEGFRLALEARGRSPQHVRFSARAALQVFDGCGFRRWSDIQAGEVERFLAAERAGKGGVSHRTSNSIAAAAGQFTRWIVASGLAAEDPLRTLRPLPVAADRRRVRRPFTLDEVRRLVAAAEAGPELEGVDGRERATAYLLSVETGLRQVELLGLRGRMLVLHGPSPVLLLDGAVTKNRQDARIPLRPALAARLGALIHGRSPSEPVFRIPKAGASAMLQSDLRAAGIAAVDHSRRVLDWHSFRYTTATELARSAVSPALLQRILRHSRVDLTLKVYTQLGAEDERAAIARLPDFAAPPEDDFRCGRSCGRDPSSPGIDLHLDDDEDGLDGPENAVAGYDDDEPRPPGSGCKSVIPGSSPGAASTDPPGTYGDPSDADAPPLGALLGAEWSDEPPAALHGRLAALWRVMRPEERLELLDELRSSAGGRP